MSVVFHWLVGALLWVALYYSTRQILRLFKKSAEAREKAKNEQYEIKSRLCRIENDITILDKRTIAHAKRLDEHAKRLDELTPPILPTTRGNL